MSVVPADAGERLVWTGRSVDSSPAGLDGWSTSDDDLAAALERAVELVVVDPLSFPWRTLSGPRRDLPLVVRLPGDVGADDLAALLGRPLFQHLTPYDRVVEPRQEVRDALAAEFRLPPEIWLSELWKGDPDPAIAPGKTALRQVVDLVGDELRRFLGDAGEGIVGVLGRSAALAPHIERAAPGRVLDYSVRAADSVPGPPESPHAVVVWLEDGGQSAAERGDVLGQALALLHPGGRLVVVGYVVTEPAGDENPRIGELVEEIMGASHALVHVDELRSVRWGAEPMSRGVLIGLTSLQVGRV